ncbi:MAG: VOC family protein [SAR324 cluster bacterium]|nr:VOC family protein [SAR324 cluster bacterium]
MITGIAHIAIKTADLDQSVRFYREILNMVEVYRPPFRFPGVWMGHDGEGGDLIHLYTGKEALDEDGGAFTGSRAIDHFALYAKGYQGYRRRFQDAGLDWKEQLVPDTERWQLFTYDPNGVMIELMFDGSQEEGAGPDMSPARAYQPGVSFYQPLNA